MSQKRISTLLASFSLLALLGCHPQPSSLRQVEVKEGSVSQATHVDQITNGFKFAQTGEAGTWVSLPDVVSANAVPFNLAYPNVYAINPVLGSGSSGWVTYQFDNWSDRSFTPSIRSAGESTHTVNFWPHPYPQRWRVNVYSANRSTGEKMGEMLQTVVVDFPFRHVAWNGETKTGTKAQPGEYVIEVVPLYDPILKSADPPSAKVGDVVALKGNNFSPDKTQNKVFFHGTAATVLDASPQELKVVVPTGFSEGGITLEIGEHKTLDPLSFKLATGDWIAKQGRLSPRTQLSSSVIGNYVYAVGGLENDQVSNKLEVYDYARDIWLEQAPMPTARYLLATSVVNEKLYAIGGYTNPDPSLDPNAGIFLNTVETYDPLTQQWESKAPMPTVRSDLGAATVDGKIYAMGGWYDPATLNTVEMYDPQIDSWQAKAAMPTARSNFATAVVEGKIYVMGGYNTGELNVVEVYDPKLNTWSVRKPMPTARERASAEVVNGRIYILGGYNSFYGPMSRVEAYDPQTDVWFTNVAPMPTLREGLSTVTLLGKILAMGGDGGPNTWSTVEEFTP